MKWIKCSERMPEKQLSMDMSIEQILFWITPRLGVGKGIFSESEEWVDYSDCDADGSPEYYKKDDVTHWMTLPEPPNEEK